MGVGLTPHSFGGALTSSGTALYVTAEDDAIELHSRLNAFGQIPPRLFVIPLPDAGGAQAFFAPDPLTKAPSTTGAWLELVAQFDTLSDLKLIVLDPLQPLCALDLNVPENAQFVCSRLAALASQTGAAVIVSHHFAKREAYTPEQAREAIRGTGGLVDGVRSVYALWHAKEDEAKSTLKKFRTSLPKSCCCTWWRGQNKRQGQPQRHHLCARHAWLLLRPK
jgi:RecA-family ATPase